MKYHFQYIFINRYSTIYCVWWSVLAAGMQIHAKWFKAELRIPFTVPTPKIFLQFTWNCYYNSIFIIIVIAELFPWKNQFKFKFCLRCAASENAHMRELHKIAEVCWWRVFGFLYFNRDRAQIMERFVMMAFATKTFVKKIIGRIVF